MILMERRVREKKNKEMVKCICLSLVCIQLSHNYMNVYLVHLFVFIFIFQPQLKVVLQTKILEKLTLQFFISSDFFLSPLSCHKDELTCSFLTLQPSSSCHKICTGHLKIVLLNNDCTGQPTIRSSCFFSKKLIILQAICTFCHPLDHILRHLPLSYCLLETQTLEIVHQDSKKQLLLVCGLDRLDDEQNYCPVCGKKTNQRQNKTN